MFKKLHLTFISILVFVATFAQNNATFPYFLSLQDGTTIPEGVFLPQPARNNAQFTDQGLILTNQRSFQFGAILLQDLAFSSNNGIEISYEFNIYGANQIGTDGFIVILYDGSIPNDEVYMGATGRSMGYVYNRANEENRNNRQKGFPGAYLGIASNITGNFKAKAFNSDVRMSGTDNIWPTANSTQGISHVTLRGAELKLPETDPYQGYRGYPVLKTISTVHTNSNINGSAELNLDGTYTYGPSLPTDMAFHLKNDGIGEDPNDPKFRKAFITLIPHPQGGFNVSVRIQHGDIREDVITNYHYRTSINFYENTNSLFGDYSTTNQNTPGQNILYTLDASVPEVFKIGFAGITGGRFNTHMIRNLRINLPYSGEATDKALIVCQNGASAFYPFLNDVAYGGHISNPSSSDELIDPTSFQFYDLDRNPTTNPYIFEDTLGNWVFDPNTKLITFTPTTSLEEQSVSAQYSFKGYSKPNGEPYGEDSYRSNHGTITLSPKECAVYVNPSLQIKVKI